MRTLHIDIKGWFKKNKSQIDLRAFTGVPYGRFPHSFPATISGHRPFPHGWGLVSVAQRSLCHMSLLSLQQKGPEMVTWIVICQFKHKQTPKWQGQEPAGRGQAKQLPCRQYWEDPNSSTPTAAIQVLEWSFPKLCSKAYLGKSRENLGKPWKVPGCTTLLGGSRRKKSASHQH